MEKVTWYLKYKKSFSSKLVIKKEFKSMIDLIDFIKSHRHYEILESGVV